VNRFDVNKLTTPEQARKSMQINNPTEQALAETIKLMEDDKKAVGYLCKKEIQEMLKLGSSICNMTYNSKFNQTRMICLEPKHMRLSWLEDSGDSNIKRINWVFHQLPWFTYQDATLGGKTHQDIVVEKVEKIMNIEFVGKEDMLPKNQTCIQQMYCRVLNQMKQNLMKKDRNNVHNVQVGLKRPKEYKLNNEKKNYHRSKTEFYVSRTGAGGGRVEFKVSMNDST
jgi:hypothetical protein